MAKQEKLEEKTIRESGEYLISNDEYHSDKDWLSSSVIKVLLDPSLYSFTVLEGKGEKKSNAGMELGNLIHTFLLEYDKFSEEYLVYEGEVNKDGSIPKKAKVALEEEANGRQIVSKQQVEFAEMARTNCLKNIHANAALFGEVGRNEVSYFYYCKDLELNLKVRPDRIVFHEDGEITIYDVKSSRNIHKNGFKRDALYNFHYDLSAYMYCYVIFKMFGKWPKFVWVVVGTRDDAPVALYPCSEKTILAGKEKFDEAIENLKIRTKEGNWNYQREPEEI